MAWQDPVLEWLGGVPRADLEAARTFGAAACSERDSARADYQRELAVSKTLAEERVAFRAAAEGLTQRMHAAEAGAATAWADAKAEMAAARALAEPALARCDLHWSTYRIVGDYLGAQEFTLFVTPAHNSGQGFEQAMSGVHTNVYEPGLPAVPPLAIGVVLEGDPELVALVRARGVLSWRQPTNGTLLFGDFGTMLLPLRTLVTQTGLPIPYVEAARALVQGELERMRDENARAEARKAQLEDAALGEIVRIASKPREPARAYVKISLCSERYDEDMRRPGQVCKVRVLVLVPRKADA